MDEITWLNDPAEDDHYHCPNHGNVGADHDIEYCLNPES